MSEGLDTGYFRLALDKARQRDLSGAIAHAQCALRINAENDQARKLLGLCLYELGELDDAAKALAGCDGLAETSYAERERMAEALRQARELCQQRKWRKAAALLQDLPHQSVRILIMRGCIKANAGNYPAAAKLFARALEKDRGNRLAGEYLTEAARRMRLLYDLTARGSALFVEKGPVQ